MGMFIPWYEVFFYVFLALSLYPFCSHAAVGWRWLKLFFMIFLFDLWHRHRRFIMWFVILLWDHYSPNWRRFDPSNWLCWHCWSHVPPWIHKVLAVSVIISSLPVSSCLHRISVQLSTMTLHLHHNFSLPKFLHLTSSNLPPSSPPP